MSIEYQNGYRTVTTCDDCGKVFDTGWGEDAAALPEGWVAVGRVWGMTVPTVACSLPCAESLALRMARSLYEPKP